MKQIVERNHIYKYFGWNNEDRSLFFYKTYSTDILAFFDFLHFKTKLLKTKELNIYFDLFI